MGYLKKVLLSFLSFLRFSLGVRGCCIYPVSCLTYAGDVLASYSFIKAVALITKRVFMCNPLVGVLRRGK